MPKQLQLPESISKLKDLAYNLWFSWNPDVRDLYREIDDDIWDSCGRNPVKFLESVKVAKVQAKSKDPDFIEKVNTAWKRLETYLSTPETAFRKNYPKLLDNQVAYFSAEYGIHESIPNYAGGLGVLAGDHTKSSSDLGVPLVAVGLMYKHAYFHQRIDAAGNQVEIYQELEFEKLPINVVKDKTGKVLLVSVPLLDREVYLKIWEVKIGRVSIFLLDTTVDKNNDEDRNIIHSLYGGSRDTRIQQEIILGIGGMRALRKMNIQPAVFHMNEGHSAFLGLERIYELMNSGMDFKTALEFVKATTLFTTHTPVPAGNETFEFDMIDKYFRNLWPQLEISHDKFFDLGRNTNIHQHENFSLTVLALNLTNQANGVSQLHGEVSRNMWQKLFPAIPTPEIPISHVTNGIHPFTWLHREMLGLFDKHLSADWRRQIRNQNYWDKIYTIPNEELWEVMGRMKEQMITHIRKTYKQRIERYGPDHGGYPEARKLLNPQALTIGFARRFAPYKRSLLIFTDMERIKKILNNADYPVQILFAGKSHPANEAGKDLIRRINELSKEEGLRGNIVFVEDYSMNNARALIAGVDVWLNTPRRPLEASGTSGQKVPVNLGINLSIPDGWWLEGYNGQNGWSIGQSRNYDDSELQDREDAESLYMLLENDVIPLFYKRNENGLPDEWIEKIKHSFHSTITQFSAHRMVWEYVQKFYVPCMKRAEKYSQEDHRELHSFTKWKNRIQRRWPKVCLEIRNGFGGDEDRRILSAGETRNITLNVNAAGLDPGDFIVEIMLERQDAYKGHQSMKIIPMGLVGKNGDDLLEYRGQIIADSDGTYRFNCRIRPVHQDMVNLHETRLVKWLD